MIEHAVNMNGIDVLARYSQRAVKEIFLPLLKKLESLRQEKGGKVLMFLSYALIDHQSDFYRKEGGDECTIKSMWGEDIPFAETYCGEGTYRKIPNPPMPMYLSCPGADKWQEKMIASADICLDLGADGVL